MLGLEKAMKILFETGDVYIDGTFKITPSLFYTAIIKGQVMGFHIILNSKMVCCLLALLPSKSTNCYLKMLEMIKNIAQILGVPDIAWRRTLVDFERALGNSLLQAFPHLFLKGCYFHYCQVWLVTLFI